MVPGKVVQAGSDQGAASVCPLSVSVASGSRFPLLSPILSSINGRADFRCGSQRPGMWHPVHCSLRSLLREGQGWARTEVWVPLGEAPGEGRWLGPPLPKRTGEPLRNVSLNGQLLLGMELPGCRVSWGAAPSSLTACGWGGGKCILGRGQGSPAQPRPGPSGPRPFQVRSSWGGA